MNIQVNSEEAREPSQIDNLLLLNSFGDSSVSHHRVEESVETVLPGIERVSRSDGTREISVLGVRLPVTDSEIKDSAASSSKDSLGVVMKRPEGFLMTDWDAAYLRDMACAIKLNHPILMPGGVSSGKTTRANLFSYLLNRKLFKQACARCEVDDLMGSLGPDKSGVQACVFHDGVVPQSIESGGLLLLDEFDQIPPDIRIRFHDLIDMAKTSERRMSFPEDNRMLDIHPNARLCCFYNPPTERNPFREAIDEAMYSRFVVFAAGNDVPEDIRTARRNFKHGIAPGSVLTNKVSDLVLSKPYPINSEIFGALNGTNEYLDSLARFYENINGMLKGETEYVPEAQPVFVVADRSESRYCEYLFEFYSGNMNETIQRALHYEYVNKFALPENRERVKEFASYVQWGEAQEPQYSRDGIEIPGSRRNSRVAVPANINVDTEPKQETGNEQETLDGDLKSQLDNARVIDSIKCFPQVVDQKDFNALVEKLVAFGTDVLPYLIAYLSDTRRKMHQGLFQCIKEIMEKDPEVGTSLIVEAIDSDVDITVRSSLARMIEYLGVSSEYGVPLLQDMLLDPIPEMRAAALYALGDYGKAAIELEPEMLRLLQDPSIIVQNAASAAFRAIHAG